MKTYTLQIYVQICPVDSFLHFSTIHNILYYYSIIHPLYIRAIPQGHRSQLTLGEMWDTSWADQLFTPTAI